MIQPDMHFIQRGWFNSNHILITGEDGAVLVDTGHRDDVAETLRLIEGAGVDPASIQLILNTHCHWDHCGGNGAIQAMSGAKVVMNKVVMNEETAVHGPYIPDEAIATAKQFAQLDAAVALPGHGNIITDVAGNVALLRQRLAAFKAEPVRMVWHLLCRVFMTFLMGVQPICRHDLITRALHAPWLHDYAHQCAPPCQLDPEPLAQQIVDEFIQRNLAREEEGMLISLVPR